MLTFLRKKKRSWAITILLAVIVLTFVLYFGGNFDQPTFRSVAVVNGDTIGPREFESQYQRAVEYYRALLKGRLTPEVLKSLNLRSAVLEELIRKRLLLQEARRLGLEAGDTEVVTAITQMPVFNIGGKFNKARYLEALRLQGITPAEFESAQKEELTIQKLFALVRDSIQITEAEVRDRYLMESESLNLQFVRLRSEDFLHASQGSAEEIKNYYEKNKESFKEPLRVQLEYLTYPFAAFAEKVQVTETEAEAFYKARRDERFHDAKAVRVRHILIRVPEGSESKAKQAARGKLESILAELLHGKDFAAAAEQYSEDPSSSQGGDVGWFGRGQLLPSLEKAAFELKKGQISQVIESPVGYHLLKVEETKEEKTKPFKEAKQEIIAEIKTEKGKAQAAEAAEEDREKLLSGADLPVVAKERGLNLKESPFLARNETLPDVGTVAEFYESAFALGSKETSVPIQGPNAFFLVRVKQRKEPVTPAFESVRSRLDNVLKSRKALELAVQKGNALLAELKGEKNLERLARRPGLQVEETGWFLRQASEIPKIGTLEEVKSGGIPVSAYQPIPAQVFTQKDAVYLFALKETRPPNMQVFEKEKPRLLQQALAEKKEMVSQKLVEGLKAKAQIEVNPAALETS